MPEATVLYSVTAVVIAALVVWVAVVFRTAKQLWVREALPASPALVEPDVPIIGKDPEKARADKIGAKDEATGRGGSGDLDLGAETTSPATPNALSEKRPAVAPAEEPEAQKTEAGAKDEKKVEA